MAKTKDATPKIDPIRQYGGLFIVLVCVVLTVSMPMLVEAADGRLPDTTWCLVGVMGLAMYGLYLHEKRPYKKMNYGELEDAYTDEARAAIAAKKKKETRKGK